MNRTPFPPDHQPDVLGTLLRGMPDAAPHAGSWDRIRARAAARQRRRRRLRIGLPLALAASVLLAIGIGFTLSTLRAVPGARTGVASRSHAKPIVTRNDQTLAQLQQHSMRLERWLAELRANGAPLQGTALASAVTLQDRIAVVDLQLDAPGHGGDRRALWRQRIGLLQDLAMLRASQSSIDSPTALAATRSAYRL